MNFFDRFGLNNFKKSYSQCGEDMIIDFIFNSMKMSKPTYLDIGAHHPTFLSNTYFFYKKGCRGVCVEPDPTLSTVIKRKRKRDVCLNVGVGITDEKEAEFFVMTTKTLNTFSKKEAERYQSYGNQRIEKIIRLPLVSVNNIIRENFSSHPNFVSLDVEGLDFQILKTFEFNIFRPEVFCIETITYTEDKTEQKLNEIISLMESYGYLTYADTYINTIFVDEKSWRNR